MHDPLVGVQQRPDSVFALNLSGVGAVLIRSQVGGDGSPVRDHQALCDAGDRHRRAGLGYGHILDQRSRQVVTYVFRGDGHRLRVIVGHRLLDPEQLFPDLPRRVLFRRHVPAELHPAFLDVSFQSRDGFHLEPAGVVVLHHVELRSGREGGDHRRAGRVVCNPLPVAAGRRVMRDGCAALAPDGLVVVPHVSDFASHAVPGGSVLPGRIRDPLRRAGPVPHLRVVPGRYIDVGLQAGIAVLDLFHRYRRLHDGVRNQVGVFALRIYGMDHP